MSYENEVKPAVKALADVATDEDKLFRDGYVKGIAQFIEECATPLTIAIQGESGTGKTSLIKLIEARLHADAEADEDGEAKAAEYRDGIIGTASIDVWQQFSANPNANLFEIILGEMLSRLSGTNLETVRGFFGLASAVSQFAGEAAKADSPDAGSGEGESPIGLILSLVFGEEEGGKQAKQAEEETVTAADVEAFRTMLADGLRQRAQEMGKAENARFVVFVDGFDLIDSTAAVNLMDQIKTYLDCPRCVFVLSVDEQTVLDGLRKKLGDKVDEGRKKLVFERLVQVPFRIPSSAYNLDRYVKDLLEGKEELAGEFAAVIDTLMVEPTLRDIKRCLNTMYLYRSVFGGPDCVQDDSLAMLLAAVILQVKSPKGFAALAECAQGGEEQFAEGLEAALGSLGADGGIKWALLPRLWQGEESDKVDAAKRDAFLTWVRKLS